MNRSERMAYDDIFILAVLFIGSVYGIFIGNLLLSIPVAIISALFLYARIYHLIDMAKNKNDPD